MPFAVPGMHLRDRTIGLMAERGWKLRARCACGHVAEWASDRLPSLPQSATVGAFAERLKCSECGGSEGIVDGLDDRSARHAGYRAMLEAEKKKPAAAGPGGLLGDV